MSNQAPARATGTAKFVRRRAQILDEASEQINEFGARGMTLTAVAKSLGLDTSSVTYYFKRKDQLAAGCFERTLHWLDERVRAAAAEPTPQARVRHLIASYVALHRDQRAPDGHKLAFLSDMRALDDESRAPLDALYGETFEVVREFFDEPRSGRARIATAALLMHVGWLPRWLSRYLERDLPRVEARLFDLLANGIDGLGEWPVDVSPLEPPAASDAQARFLHAATTLINRQGYIGASVEKIAAELGVSTGSFYHHLDNKDDLVVACFRRSFDLYERAHDRGDRAGERSGDRLGATISLLVAQQFAGESPLLRTAAFQALPRPLRGEMMERTEQMGEHMAGIVADGIADGSLRAVDPTVAGQVILGTINAAANLRDWAERRPLEEAVRAYVLVLRRGLFFRGDDASSE